MRCCLRKGHILPVHWWAREAEKPEHAEQGVVHPSWSQRTIIGLWSGRVGFDCERPSRGPRIGAPTGIYGEGKIRACACNPVCLQSLGHRALAPLCTWLTRSMTLLLQPCCSEPPSSFEPSVPCTSESGQACRTSNSHQGNGTSYSRSQWSERAPGGNSISVPDPSSPQCPVCQPCQRQLRTGLTTLLDVACL